MWPSTSMELNYIKWSFSDKLLLHELFYQELKYTSIKFIQYAVNSLEQNTIIVIYALAFCQYVAIT